MIHKLVGMVVMAVLVCGFAGCGKEPASSGQPSGGGIGVSSSVPEAPTAIVNQSATPTITITPANPTAKVGEEFVLTGVLSRIPEGKNRWTMSVGWDSSDGQQVAQSLKENGGRYENTATFTWNAAGTYQVTLKYYASNASVLEQTVDVTVK